MSKQIIVIVGVTGNQGFSVAESFLSSGVWHVRGITRNPSSAKAQELISLGAEVVQGDLDDLDSLIRAFDSVHAIFANTDFWTTYYNSHTPERATASGKSAGKYSFDVEVSHGRNIADAAAGVSSLKRFIFSSLPPARKASDDDLVNCYHWEAKVAIAQYIPTAHPKLAAVMSTIYLGCYTANDFIVPRWDKRSSSYKIMIPMGPKSTLPIVDPTKSTGPLVYALVEAPPGKHLLACDTNSILTMPQVAGIRSRVTGKAIEYENTPPDYLNKEFGIPFEILAGPVLIDRNHYMHGVDEYIEPCGLDTKVRTTPYKEWVSSNWRGLLPPEI